MTEEGKVFRVQPRKLSGVFSLLATAVLVASAGCMTKAKARAQARDAFIAGQQESFRQMQQNQTPTVTFFGPVNNAAVLWTKDLTLAQALLKAEYTGR